MTIGFASHLILDEIWAIDLRGGHVRFKSSFGTAIKFFGQSTWSNCTTYAKLAILTFAMFEDPNVVSDMRQDTPAVANQPAAAASRRLRRIVDRLAKQSAHLVAGDRGKTPGAAQKVRAGG